MAVGRCNTAAINCMPANTNNDNTLVVRPFVDITSVASQTRRVWVQVTSWQGTHWSRAAGFERPSAVQHAVLTGGRQRA